MKRYWQKKTEWGQDECPPVIQTTEEYNNLVQRIRINDKTWFNDFVKLCGHYYENNPCGGSIHVVLDDGSLEDTHVSWCAGYACGKNDQEGSDLAEIMSMMSLAQRKRVYKAYPYRN